MQIQLWGRTVLSGAETVPQTTTHDKLRAESDSSHKVSRKPWVKKHEEWIDRATLAQQYGALRRTRSFPVGESNAQPWWRTKLNFGSAEPFE